MWECGRRVENTEKESILIQMEIIMMDNGPKILQKGQAKQ